MSGFILSYRKIWDNPIFEGNAARVGVWDWMLKNAAWRDTQHIVGSQIITVKRGQLCVSQAQITRATGMARQPLRTLLNLLEKTNAIQTKSNPSATKGKNLITICNYDDYQSRQDIEQPKSNQRATKEQPTKETREQLTKENNLLLFSENPEPQREPGTSDLFDTFWKIYPKGGGKEDAKKAWFKAIKRERPEKIIAAAERLALLHKNKRPGEFIPNPKMAQGWLNGSRWNDEELQPSQRSSKYADLIKDYS